MYFLIFIVIIAGDLARVEDEEHEINAAIRERSSAEHEDVDRFTEKKAKVEGELEELRKAVALKEQELAQLQVGHHHLSLFVSNNTIVILFVLYRIR